MHQLLNYMGIHPKGATNRLTLLAIAVVMVICIYAVYKSYKQTREHQTAIQRMTFAAVCALLIFVANMTIKTQEPHHTLHDIAYPSVITPNSITYKLYGTHQAYRFEVTEDNDKIELRAPTGEIFTVNQTDVEPEILIMKSPM